ncbi:hypothetical protein Tco_0068503, partial [Tanacetum coccineum]
ARRRRQPQVRQTSVESSNLEKPDNPPVDVVKLANSLEPPTIKVNEQRLKKYYGGNIDEEDDEVIEFENGVTSFYTATSMEKKSTMLVKYRSFGILCVL